MAKLIFHYGVMGAGKSAELTRLYYNFRQIKDYETVVLKPSSDTRSDPFSITSRSGTSIPCAPFDPRADLASVISDRDTPPHAILVDEAQFLSIKQVDTLAQIVDYMHCDVHCFGLRSDSSGKFFEGSQALFLHADELVELNHLCNCGNKATHNLRFANGKAVNDGGQIVIGDIEETAEVYYKPACRSCWRSALNPSNGADW